MLYTDEYIETWFNGCKLKDFIPNAQGIIENDELTIYVDNLIETVKNDMPENVENNIANCKTKYEIQQAATDVQVMFLNTISEISKAVLNYLGKKYYDDSDIYKRVLANIVNHSSQHFDSIFAMYTDNTKIAILPEMRILYENYIVFSFIGRHPEVAQLYYDHAILNKYKIVKKYNLIFTEKEAEDEKRLLNIYGENFLKHYAWIPKQYLKHQMGPVESMEKDKPFSASEEIYKISSEYIHSSPFSVFHEKIVTGLVSHYLYSVVGLFTSQIIELTRYYKCEPKDHILTMNLFYGLREDLYGEPPFIVQK
jgi:hypothetical protein